VDILQMKYHTAITILALLLLAALGLYAKMDTSWAMAAVCGAHGGANAMSERAP
jgi:hypothetical protein